MAGTPAAKSPRPSSSTCKPPELPELKLRDVWLRRKCQCADRAYQATHAPLEAPKRFLEDPACAHVGEVHRHIFCAMTRALDEGVGNISRALGSNEKMRDDTVIIWSTSTFFLSWHRLKRCPESDCRLQGLGCTVVNERLLWPGTDNGGQNGAGGNNAP